MKLLVISGSLRKASYNTALCRALKKLTEKDDRQIEIFTLHDIPFFNADVEAAGDPASVQELKAKVAAADGIIFSTPEYNNMVPGVLKNALEWLSRHESGDNLKDKPVAIMGASDGGFGTVRAQNLLLQLCSILHMRTSGAHRLPVSKAQDKFDAQGALTDTRTQEKLVAFVDKFSDWIAPVSNSTSS